MKLKTRRIIRFLWFYFISLAVLSLILFFRYISHKLLETSITVILFFIFRKLFIKQYHAKSLYLCALISILIFGLIIIPLELNKNISILSPILLTFLVNLISFNIKEYKDNKILLDKYKLKLKTINTKALENITENELYQLLPSIDYRKLKIVYEYLHKPKDISADEFALKYNLSAISIYKYVKFVRDEYSNLSRI